MSDQCIIFSPERNQWTLADGWHHMEVPEWAREIMRDEFERETRPLHDSLDLALDSKRIAERRVTELLAENAKLREELADAPKCETCEAMLDCDECLRADGSHKERRRLSAENARLRSELESVGTASYLYGRSDLKAENAKLRELVALMYRDMQGVLDMSTDTVWVDDVGTLRDEMDCHMQAMAELGMPPADYERRIHELGVEVE